MNEKANLLLRDTSNLLAYKLKDNKKVKNALANALNLISQANGKELPIPIIKYMIEDCFEIYSHTTLQDHIEAFKRVGREKSYGKITLASLHEKLAEIEEENAIERERNHEANKK